MILIPLEPKTKKNSQQIVKNGDKRRYATGECFGLDHQYSLQEFEYEEINKNPDTV